MYQVKSIQYYCTYIYLLDLTIAYDDNDLPMILIQQFI